MVRVPLAHFLTRLSSVPRCFARAGFQWSPKIVSPINAKVLICPVHKLMLMYAYVSINHAFNPLRLSGCSDFSGSPASLSRYSSELSASGRLPAAGSVRQRQQ